MSRGWQIEDSTRPAVPPARKCSRGCLVFLLMDWVGIGLGRIRMVVEEGFRFLKENLTVLVSVVRVW